MIANSEAITIILQFGFAGVLLVFVYLVNRQFIILVNALDRHLERLTGMLELCIELKKSGDMVT